MTMLNHPRHHPGTAHRVDVSTLGVPTGFEVPTGIPGNTGRAAMHAARVATSAVALRTRGTSGNDLPKFPGQRRSDWWVELPELVTREVTLRSLRQTDAASLVAMLSSPKVEEFITPAPATLEEARGFIEWTHSARQAGRYICFGIVPPGHTNAVGIFQIWPIEQTFRTAEWGFAIGHQYWGSGLFIESARLVADFAFDTLGAARIEGRAAAENARGSAALRKLGAVPEGRLRRCFACTGGVVRDHVLWALLDDDWRRVRPSLIP
jgi:RimJ/RimL family protein N-acetyltransferase